jgi:hypothetical protein
MFHQNILAPLQIFQPSASTAS